MWRLGLERPHMAVPAPHAGWAIEGAIGSEFKIDASYLSPHVNMAARLEAATKQFGTSMLMSGTARHTQLHASVLGVE